MTASNSFAGRGPKITKPATANLKQILAATPTRNTAVREESRGEALVLFVPIRKRWWMAGPLSWCLPLRDEKGVALDAIGQEVWQACDGQRNLETLVEDFADRHRLGFHEARLTVMRFLRMLAQRNLLVLVGSTQVNDGESDRSGNDSLLPPSLEGGAGGGCGATQNSRKRDDNRHPPLTPPSREGNKRSWPSDTRTPTGVSE